MKRKYVYVGGTILLALLGGIGAYFLFSGGDEGSNSQAEVSSEPEGKADDMQPIEVLPVAADAFQNVPPVQDVSSVEGGAPRYAMGGSAVASPGAYATPVPRGTTPHPDDVEQSERPSARGLPAGEPEIPDMHSQEALDDGAAATPAQIPFPGSRQQEDLITRGQEPATGEAAEEDLENSLRDSARAAFTTGEDSPDAPPAAEVGAAMPPIEGSRYGAADPPSANPQVAGDYGAVPALPIAEQTAEDATTGAVVHSPQDLLPLDTIPNAAEPGISAPAPMTVADAAAEPLPVSAAPAEGELQPVPGSDYAGPGGLSRSETATSDTNTDAYQFSRPEGSAALTSPDAFGMPSGANTISSARQPFAGTSGNSTSLGDASSAPNTLGGGVAGGGGEGSGRPGEPALEGPQAPQVSVEKLAPGEIQVGKKCTFSVVVRNVGSVAARDVRLVDEIPLGTQLVATSPRATVLGSQLEWELGTLAPGDEVKVDVELLPVNEGEIGSVAHVQLAAAATARVQCTRPVLELVTDVPPSVLIGEQQVLRITLRNPGSGDATGVMLLENVPEGMNHPHGRDLEFEVGTLRAGESRELELVLTAERKGIVQNRIVAKGDGNLYTESIAEFEVVAPEIAVSVDGPTRKYLELPATFTVAIENPGTAAASDIELVGKLPEGLEFVSADKYGQYDEATRSVYWSLAELPPRERGEVKLVAMPVELGEQRIEVKADARLGLVGRAEAKLQVEGLAALKSEVTDISDPVEVGGETSYEIRVVNQGSKPATNVQVVAQLPDGLGAVRADGPTPNPRVEPRQVTFAPLERLSPKADATYRIDVRGLAPGDQRILVMIMTDDLAAPIKEEESTRVYADR